MMFQSGINQKLSEFRQSLEWVERLDLTNPPAPPPPGAAPETDADDGNLANSDFKRELRL